MRLRPRCLAHRGWAPPRTIRVRLTLWYVALLALILVAFSTFVYASLSRGLHAEVDRSLVATLQQAAATLDLEDGQPTLGEGPDAVPSGTVTALYDRTGQRLLASDPRQPLPNLAEALAAAARGEQHFDTVSPRDQEWRVLTAPLVVNGQSAGILQLARSDREVETALRQLLLLLAVAVPCTLLLAVAGGLFLAGRALTPIDHMTRAAAAIGADDLGRRLDASTRDEMGRLASTFNEMLARLDRAFQRQRQFTADASHELRTPLALMASEIDVARDQRRTPAEYARVLDSLREDVTRMSLLVGQLLTLARAEDGREALQREPLDLAALAEGVTAALQPLADARGVHLGIGISERAVVDGDQARLTQLVVNLVDNAVKYTPREGSVTVAVRRAGTWATLEVADTGPGIAPEHLPHLFERFYRVDQARARKEGGTGLGLAISQWIAHAHGGTITARSTLGTGSTFTVRLPAVATPATSPSISAPRPAR